MATDLLQTLGISTKPKTSPSNTLNLSGGLSNIPGLKPLNQPQQPLGNIKVQTVPQSALNVIFNQKPLVTTPPPAIQSTQLSDQQKTPVLPPVNTNFSNTQSNLKSSYTPTITNQPSIQTNTRQSLLDEYRGLQDELTGKRAFTEKTYKKAGIAEKEAELADVTNLIAEKTIEYDKKKLELEKNPQGLFGGALIDAQNDLERESNRDLAYLAIRQEALQGNADRAYTIADKLIAAEYEPKLERLKAIENLYTMWGNDLTDSEKAQLQQTYDKELMEIEQGYKQDLMYLKDTIDTSSGGAGMLNPANFENKTTYTPEDIASLPVSDVTKAVISGYGSMKDLTPTVKSEVLSELYRIGYNPKQFVLNKLQNLVGLYQNIPDSSRGIVEGLKFWEANTMPAVGAFESAKNVLTREIARLNDVGVLSDQDVATYKESMPSRQDENIDVVLGKLRGLGLSVTGNVGALVGKRGKLPDGREFIVDVDGETLLDPNTGLPLE